MNIGRLLLACLFAALSQPAALASALDDSPYFELGGSAEPTAKALREARRQVDEHRRVEPRKTPGLSPFHKRRPRPQAGRKPLCLACHADPPHRRHAGTRSFLNMHATRVACETCHFQPAGVRFAYRWLAYGEPPTAKVDKAAVKEVTDHGPPPSIVPDAVSRLAPFLDGEPALRFLDQPAGDEVRHIWDGEDKGAKARLQARLHRSLKKAGRRCSDCHSRRQTLLDWQALGADPRQARAIEDNPVARFVARQMKRNADQPPDGEARRLRMTELLR